jgi:hypothetical protein
MERFDQLKEKADGLDAEQKARLTAERLRIRPLKEKKLARKIDESAGNFVQRVFDMCRTDVERRLGENEPKETRLKGRKEVDRGGR